MDRLDEFVVALEKEVELRTQLVGLLEKSEIFYDAQLGEARIVANVSLFRFRLKNDDLNESLTYSQ